jgi:hypothetical protein
MIRRKSVPGVVLYIEGMNLDGLFSHQTGGRLVAISNSIWIG